MGLPEPAVAVSGVVALPDGRTVELTPEQAEELLRIREEAEQRRIAAMKSLLVKLEARCAESIRAKAEIEKRWVDDLRQYEGLPRVVGGKDEPRPSDATPPRIHRTRSRTDMMEARLSDMLLTQPAWDTSPTPDPVIPDDLRGPNPQTGAPYTPAEIDAELRRRNEAMRRKITDDLKESRFNASGRKMIRDGCRIGCGLVMGPMNALRYKRKFRGPSGMVQLEIIEQPKPEIREGDPWRFYPEMVSSAEKAQYAHYLHLMSELELQEFAKHQGVKQDAVARLLRKSPELGAVAANLGYRNQWAPQHEATANRYAVWRYTGVLDREEAKCLDLNEYSEPKEAESEEGADQLRPMPMVDMWYCQGEVLKAKIAPLEGDYRIPYFVYSPFPADDTMFGYSLPYLCRESQRVADAAYQIMLHNASVSSGPIIFARREAFEPKRGETMTANGPRWYWITDPDVKISDAIHVIEFPNNAEQAMAILDRALEILDDELNMPQLIGDVSASKPLTETASGMAMLMNQMITIMQRRAAAAFDDDVIVPMIERLYWWHMMYDDDPAIQGVDCQVDALGQSVLLVRDIRIQQLMMFLNMAQNDPEINASEIKRELAELLDIPVDRFFRTPEELAQIQANQPEDVETIKARALEMNAQAAIERIKAEAMNAQRDDEFRREERLLKHREVMAELQRKERADQKDIIIAYAQLEQKRAELIQAGQLEIAQIDKVLQVEDMRNAMQQYQLGFKARVDLERDAMEARIEAPSPRLA